ncbi:GNAT family N-acetyltransferase [Methylopila musalis]|uniref:GNAT family N-acetyltransferase n=1 Tax=Methylopila musalis TaxID=1134781 RepID=A0ABW3Z6G2_9HYPH
MTKMPTDASAPFDQASSDRTDAAPSVVARLTARLKKLLADRSDTAVAQKVAGGAFLFRVGNAGIAFASQILLARWMGENEYGVYVYVWTWVLLLGGVTSLGLASSPQRFIPEYADAGRLALLRGFLLGSRLLSIFFATTVTAIGLLGLWLFGDHLANWAVVPLYLALICVPMYVLTDVQDGIARSYNWIDVALAPAYLVRPLLILLLLGILSYAHYEATAVTAMAGTIIATWVTAVAQLVMLERRLARKAPAGPRAYDMSGWMKVSLPIFMVEGFYLLLAYTDVLVLSVFVEPHHVGVYYAAVKVMSLVAFVSFSVSAAVAHRFTEYSVTGDRERLEKMVRDAARWTFWPSLFGCAVLLALGWPILWLFGEAFTEGYPLLFVIAIGLLARATVGPLERLLNMLGQQNICAAVYGGAFLLNLGLAFALIPHFGVMGAAMATSATLTIESVILFVVTRRRLGLGALPWGGGSGGAPRPEHLTGDAVTDAVALPYGAGFGAPVPAAVAAASSDEAPLVELLDADAMEARLPEWRALVARALEPNPFCEPDFALAAIRRCGAFSKTRFVAAWATDADGDRRMVALAAVEPRLSPAPLTLWSSTHWGFFGALGLPLMDGDRPVEAADALFRGLAASGHRLFQFRFLPESGPTAAALRSALAASGRAMTRVDHHARALLETDLSAEAYLTQSLSSKKLKELRRQFRRLSDDAPAAFVESRGVEAAEAFDRFVALEASGWKGERRSALRDNPQQLAFVREMLLARAMTGGARVLELRVGEQTIACGLILVSQRRAWFYKVAYDEGFARCSPGVQLTIELTRRMIEDPEIDGVDSTSVANHPMIDHIWRERLVVADWVVATRPGPATIHLAAAVRAERFRDQAHVALRKLYHRVKGTSR